MERRQNILVLFGLACFIIHLTVGEDVSAQNAAIIQSSFENFDNALELIKSSVSNKKLIEGIESLSSVLGAVGGFVSLLLIFSTGDSDELAYMKEQFSSVNLKLDHITETLDTIEDMITLENQRSAYVDSANKLLMGYSELTQNYIAEVSGIQCTDKRDCLRKRLVTSERYVDTFNVKRELHEIMNGAATSSSVFSDSLLNLVASTTKCDFPKMNRFASGVIKLAFKGQQVVLAYEKLTGSNFSISAAMNEWTSLVYNIRDKLNAVTKDCYDNLDSSIKADVQDTKYQLDEKTYNLVADDMRADLEQKYTWPLWVVVTYKKGKTFGEGFFQNSPPDDSDNSPVFIAAPKTENGNYAVHYQEFSKALDTISSISFQEYQFRNPEVTFTTIRSQLKKRLKWWDTHSILVVSKDIDGVYLSENPGISPYVYDNVRTMNYLVDDCTMTAHGGSCQKTPETLLLRITAVLASNEEIQDRSCPRSCSNEGECLAKPYSLDSSCICKQFYGGDNCENYSKTHVASNIDVLLTITAKIPKLVDIFFELHDLQDAIGASFDNVEKSFAELDVKLERKFNEINKQISNEFEWSNLITHYSQTVRDITYYLGKFTQLNAEDTSKGKELAEFVLRVENIERWVSEVNYLVVGRHDTPLTDHKPMIFNLMERYGDTACSSKYKQLIDDVWKEILLFQSRVYNLWINALSIKKEPADHVTTLYQSILSDQNSIMESLTCELEVENSVNLHCSGGFYLYPQQTVENTCEADFYLDGTQSVTCASGITSCKACNCNPEGSSSTECPDNDGQCICNDNYYGKTCSDRDCVWGSYSAYSSCSKSCGYGGTQTRRRQPIVTQKGQGTHCIGDASETRSCFNGCCTGFFNCDQDNVCLAESKQCNYILDCSNPNDESDCNENCVTKYTTWKHASGNKATNLKDHRVNCGGGGKVLQSFRLETSGGQIRYKFVCCTLFDTSITWGLKYTHTSYDDDGNEKVEYLDRHWVTCSYDLINDFWLESTDGEWRYNYYCQKVRSYQPFTTECYRDATPIHSDDGGSVHTLRHHAITCPSRYFVSSFSLDRTSDHDHFYIDFKCCKIIEE